MAFYHSTISNKKGDIITMPTGTFSDENMIITIPNKHMIKNISNKNVFNSLRIITPMSTLILFALAMSFATDIIAILTMVIFVFSFISSCAIHSPEIITRLGGKRIIISPKYFSSKYYGGMQSMPLWEKQHQTEFLDLLDNELIRDDFIELLKTVERDNISPQKSKELYTYMKEVGLTERNLSQKAINDMIEKYQYYANAMKDIRHIHQ